MMNTVGMSFLQFGKAMTLIRRDTDLKLREISDIKIVLENDNFVIEIIPKEVQDNG